VGNTAEARGGGAGRRAVPGSAGRQASAGWGSSRPRAERARQLADVLRQRITSGDFADRVLPDEQRLGAVFGASRNAVREALGLLRVEGLITRRPGVGTTVVMPKYGHGIDRLAGLAEVLTGYGTVTNQVRVAEVVPRAPVGIAERLELPPGAGAVRIERLRRLDGLPLSLDTSYLTPEVGHEVLGGDLADRGDHRPPAGACRRGGACGDG